ncbi:ATP-binding protein [Colwellia psychrerythraea]|uniref:histidine kinase n=1 Tax=Colwellia psychrerythraea TaxID=28229 RepID=A0A099KA42_COLPS|nr:ATP-binding protein [Colwellia psychrerythraea]KGJ86488.1 integral membrane sensor signal transduction histidine kinase [Colwellia psychrerythraea]
MKIQNKLFVFLFSYSLILVTVLVLLIQWSIGKGMVEYVISKEIDTLKPVLTNLSKEYQKENNWRSMTDNHPRFRQLISEQLTGSDFESKQKKFPPEHRRFNKTEHRPAHMPEHMPMHRPPPPKGFGKRPPPESEAHYALLDIDKKLIVGNYLKTLEYVKTPININNQVIGYFAISKRNQLTQGYEVDFIKQQQHYLWLIGLFVMSLVVLVTLPLARHVVEPIKLITRGMHKLTQGDYQQTIELKRQDELSELSRDYNELALTLAENENARKRWLANISHELRTPVAILRGELEAMLDKVRPITENNIASANDEVKHLQRLIDDLNLLTSADIGGMRYRKQTEELVSLIQSEADKYRGYLADAGIELTLELGSQQSNIYADKNRLFQLFENIINNAIKYSSATQFHISITFEKSTKNVAENILSDVTITLADNGVGVDEVHFIHLFEHLYRVEDSRNRKTGGSGLGLSICRHIVTAHQGEISAQKSNLGGLAVKISLPLS